MKRNHSKKAFRIVFALVAVAIAVIAVSRYRANQRGRQAAQAAATIVEQIAAAGEPTNMLSLAQLRASLARSNNASEVFDGIFALQPASLSFDLQKPRSGRGKRKEPLSSELAAECREFVSANSNYFAALDRLATAPPYALMTVSFEGGFETTAELLQASAARFRRAAQMLEARCYWNMYRGEADEALHDIDLIMRMSHALTLESETMAFLVRVACVDTATRCAERFLNQHKPSAVHLSALEQAFTKTPSNADLRAALVGERALGLSAFDEVHRAGEGLPATVRGSNAWHEDRLFFLDFMGKLIATADQPYHEAVRTANDLHGELLRTVSPSKNQYVNWFNLAVRRRYMVTAILAPPVPAVVRFGAEATARKRLLLTAITLERHLAKRGDLPASLEVLRELPNLDERVDPYSGAPFKYSIGDAKYLLYSVGSDFDDDGGAASRRTVNGNDGDIPFEVFINDRR